MRTVAVLRTAALVGVCVLPGAMQAACADPPPRRADAFGPVTQAINAHRSYLGKRPLRTQEDLQAVADSVVAEIERRGTTRNVDLGISAFVDRLRRRGYAEHRLVVGTVSGGSPEEVAEQWPEIDPQLWQRFLDPDLREIAVAAGRAGDRPLVLVLAAVRQSEFLAERAEELELATVRRVIRERTNELRRKRGLWELRPHRRLDEVAQKYAEDMIARDFYGHRSPEGSTVMDRVTAGGYAAAFAGENLAAGSADPLEVFAGWTESPMHRENLLHSGFRHLGVGLARGWTGDGGYRIVWVQVFGRSHDR